MCLKIENTVIENTVPDADLTVLGAVVYMLATGAAHLARIMTPLSVALAEGINFTFGR